MRLVAVLATLLALLAQPVLAQDDAAMTGKARELTAQALAADAEIVARNEAARADYNARAAAFQQALAAQQAAEAKYKADLAAQQAAAARYEADKAAWEAACRSGKYSRCAGT